MGMFGNIKSLAYHDNDADDPYITLKEVGSPQIQNDLSADNHLGRRRQ